LIQSQREKVRCQIRAFLRRLRYIEGFYDVSSMREKDKFLKVISFKVFDVKVFDTK